MIVLTGITAQDVSNLKELGYVTRQDRSPQDTKKTHLYKGTFSDPGLPMCSYGWNRDYGFGYSIWQGNIGRKGICKLCLARANKGLPGVETI